MWIWKNKQIKILFLGILVFFFNLPIIKAEYPPRTEPYTIKSGDNLYRIAKRFYGNSNSKHFLLAVRPDLKSSFPKPGTRIKIPRVINYTVRGGDTLGKISNEFLGSSNRFPFLMASSELPDYPIVEAGTPLKIPFSIEIKLGQQDTLKSISKKYYLEPYALEMILAYNNLPRNLAFSAPEPSKKKKKNQLPDEPISLPNQLDLPLLTFISQEQSGKPMRTRRGSTLLINAMDAYKEGRFEECLDLLNRGRKIPWNTFFEWSLIHRYQGFALIALGNVPEAKKHLMTMKMLDPEVALDPMETSPKVLRVFQGLAQVKTLSKIR